MNLFYKCINIFNINTQNKSSIPVDPKFGIFLYDKNEARFNSSLYSYQLRKLDDFTFKSIDS